MSNISVISSTGLLQLGVLERCFREICLIAVLPRIKRISDAALTDFH